LAKLRQWSQTRVWGSVGLSTGNSIGMRLLTSAKRFWFLETLHSALPDWGSPLCVAGGQNGCPHLKAQTQPPTFLTHGSYQYFLASTDLTLEYEEDVPVRLRALHCNSPMPCAVLPFGGGPHKGSPVV